MPVSISYELDPCAATKAKELYFMDRDGKYDKNEGEDIRSMATGIFGFKGRVHVSFGARVEGGFEQAEDLLAHVDRMIVRNLKTYPTHVLALDRLRRTRPEGEKGVLQGTRRLPQGSPQVRVDAIRESVAAQTRLGSEIRIDPEVADARGAGCNAGP